MVNIQPAHYITITTINGLAGITCTCPGSLQILNSLIIWEIPSIPNPTESGFFAFRMSHTVAPSPNRTIRHNNLPQSGLFSSCFIIIIISATVFWPQTNIIVLCMMRPFHLGKPHQRPVPSISHAKFFFSFLESRTAPSPNRSQMSTNDARPGLTITIR